VEEYVPRKRKRKRYIEVDEVEEDWEPIEHPEDDITTALLWLDKPNNAHKAKEYVRAKLGEYDAKRKAKKKKGKFEFDMKKEPASKPLKYGDEGENWGFYGNL